MIDYISIHKGKIELYSADPKTSESKVSDFVFASNNPVILADVALRHGGLTDRVMCSSSFIEASCGCEESAFEAGFGSSKEVADLWDAVCSYV